MKENMPPEVLITTSTFGDYDPTPLELLKKSGFNYTLNPYRRQLAPQEFLSLANRPIGIIAGTERLDATILESIRSVKAISRCGAGVDNVDLAAAQRLSIIVTNTPDSATQAVAELTIGLMISLLRKIHLMNGELKTGRWRKVMGNLIEGKKIGLLGFGRIGQRVGRLARAFGAAVGFYDPAVSSSEHGRFMDFHSLLSWAEILSLHVSGCGENGYLLNSGEFSKMENGAYLINCSRGSVICEAALLDALKRGKLSGAALDVFDSEPYKGPLIQFENVILTPHVGSYAKEARIHMEIEAVQNLLKSLEGHS